MDYSDVKLAEENKGQDEEKGDTTAGHTTQARHDEMSFANDFEVRQVAGTEKKDDGVHADTEDDHTILVVGHDEEAEDGRSSRMTAAGLRIVKFFPQR